MKTFTFFYNRYTTATTSIALAENNIEHTVLCHTKRDGERFKRYRTAKGHVVATGRQKGLSNQRNAALDMMQEGEWAAFLCDDLMRCVARPISEILGPQDRLDVTTANQAKFRVRKGKDDITLAQMYSTFPYLTKQAEAKGINLIGFGLHDNPLNLRRKFGYHGLADGRFWLVRKTHLRFDENVQMIDDVAWTAENIKTFGAVMVCNWIIPYFRRYTADGFGSIPERLEQRRKECAYLVEKYSPLVRFAAKPGWPEGSHIRLQYSGAVAPGQQEFAFGAAETPRKKRANDDGPMYHEEDES